jgi:streptomycin 6-kinase
VRAKARDAGADAWLENLPRLVGDLCAEWGLRPGAAFGDATEAYVMSVTRGDGTPAVLKLLVPRRGAAAAHEITVLRLAAGDGCCRLHEHDESRGALLLEHLGPAMSDLNLPQPQRLTILTDLATALWRPVTRPDAASLPTGLTKAQRLARYIPAKWAELGEPCTRRAVDQAVEAARSRARAWDPERAVLAHGDVHQWNALRVIGEAPRFESCQEPRAGVRHFSAPSPGAAQPAIQEGAPGIEPSLLGCSARCAAAERARHGGGTRESSGSAGGAGGGVGASGRVNAGGAGGEGDDERWRAAGCGGAGWFKLVDPDGIVAEPEYDLGVLMREDPVELMDGDPWARARWLAARTGTDPVAIWEWGLVERVATGLVLTVAGVQPVARQMLAAADEIGRRF